MPCLNSILQSTWRLSMRFGLIFQQMFKPHHRFSTHTCLVFAIKRRSESPLWNSSTFCLASRWMTSANWQLRRCIKKFIDSISHLILMDRRSNKLTQTKMDKSRPQMCFCTLSFKRIRWRKMVRLSIRCNELTFHLEYFRVYRLANTLSVPSQVHELQRIIGKRESW